MLADFRGQTADDTLVVKEDLFLRSASIRAPLSRPLSRSCIVSKAGLSRLRGRLKLRKRESKGEGQLETIARAHADVTLFVDQKKTLAKAEKRPE